MAWQLQDAKNKFSEVVHEAQKEPQVIMVRGEEKAVVMSAERYRELTCKGSLLSFLQTSPWADVELDLSRSKDTGRDVELRAFCSIPMCSLKARKSNPMRL